MNNLKPVFLKTYGKQKQKSSTWILTKTHKRVFDSSQSTEDSVFEAPKPKKTRLKKKAGVGTRGSLHPPRKKAALRPTNSYDEGNTSNEENIIPRRQKTTVTRGRLVCPAKRKSIPRLKEFGSDPSHVDSPVFTPPQQSDTTRTTLHVSATGDSHRQSDKQVSVINQSKESMSAPKPTNSFKRKRTSGVCPPSVGRFVTRRRHSVARKPPKPPKAMVMTTSDDFSSEEISTNNILRPRRRKILPALLLSSAENSLNPEGASSLTSNPFREISLNVDHSPIHCSRKPIFCSTPSAGFYTKPGRLKSSPINDQSSIPVSRISVNCPTVSTFQENTDSSELPAPVQHSDIVKGSPSQEKLQPSPGELQKEPELNNHEDHSVVLFTEATSCSSSEEINRNSEKSKTNDGEQLQSVILISTDNESDFVSAAAGLEWLIEVLKESCLTNRCMVQLERLDHQTVTQLCSQTTYSSCLEYSHSDHIQSTNPSTDTKMVSTEEKVALLKEQCLRDKLVVKITKLSQSQLKGTMMKSHTYTSASDDQTETDHLSKDDCYDSSMTDKKVDSSSCEDSSDKEVRKDLGSKIPKRKKIDKEKKKCNVSTDQFGTTRKACVSGMSVNRWKNKGTTSTHVFRSRAVNSTVDCSINDLIPTQHVWPKDLFGGTMNFCTPVRASQLNLNLSSLLGHTHTWSRLKAAVSVHRKMVLSPSSHLSTLSRMEDGGDVSQDLFATPSRTPFSKRLLSQLTTHHSSVACEDDDLSDAEKVFAECGQQHTLPWEECILPQRMKQCVKIGEGTFGEIFSTTNASGDTVALKVIPIEGSEKVNGEDQKTFGEILHEIIISKELSSLKEKKHNQTHGFIGLKDLHCVKGCYPPDFLNAWDTFDRCKGSENDRPDFFEEDQIFLILEFEFGGVDLENSNGKLSSLMVAKSILHQVTAALAVAEQELFFEHRDLHWGNVLVKSTRQKNVSFLLNGKAYSLDTKGVLVRIIDYSLSRLEIDDLTVSCDIANDEALFMGQGDYQFEIYRMMRKENGNNWSNYHPYTNVLWLHYLCTKLLSMKYRTGRGAKDTREELTRFHGNVLQYSSAMDVLQNCPMFQ